MEGVGGRNAHSQGEGVLIATILVVEDDVYIRDISVRMLDDLGHRTLPACNMDEAFSVLGFPEPIDALFTNIRLNSAALGGFELAQQGIKLRPQLRVLYTTGSSITDKMTALFVRSAHFLEKPYTQHQLQNSVEEMLAASF
jgi:DNA-binding NtrC family response regulator